MGAGGGECGLCVNVMMKFRVATWAVAQVYTLSAEISGAGGAHCQAIVFPSYRQGSLLGGHIVGE